MVKFVGSALIIITMLLAPVAASAVECKIGVVDSNAIVMNSAAGKAVQEAIKRKAEELGRPLGTKRQELGRQVDEFQKQAGLMKADARKAKQAELEKKMADFDKQAKDADKQLAQFRENQLKPLNQKLQTALEQVSREEKLDLILDKAVVNYYNKNLDYTDKVRAKFGF
jgi:outer membrane protein